jgi:MFS family permease
MGSLHRLSAVLARLAKQFVEPNSPTYSDLDYWTEEAKQSRAQRRRNRRIAGWSVGATIAIILAVMVALVGFSPVVFSIHFAVVAAAVVLLSVPKLRRWLLSQAWPPVFLPIVIFGVLYIGAFWPKALGGMSVGIVILLAVVVVILLAFALMMISEWRKDRLLAISQVIMLVILSASMIAGDHYLGKTFGWLIAVVPTAACLGVIWLIGRRRSQRGNLN